MNLSGFRNPAFAAASSAFGFPDVGLSASPAFTDIDGDGDLDAFISNRSGNTLFFRNTGSATAPAFAGSASPFGLPDVGYVASPAFADIDGDGDLDAFIGDRLGNTFFFRNTGSATAPAFASSASAFGLPDVGDSASPAFADSDGDGDLDAFIGESYGNTLFFRNTGSATAPAFSGSSGAIGLPDVGSLASPVFADSDGDGDLDAFIGNRSGNTLFFRNTGSATAPAFACSANAFVLPNGGLYASPAFADIDGDGDLDAFIGERIGNTLFFRNTGSGGLTSTTANGTYGLGNVIRIEVPLSEAVVVDTTNGIPTLRLETGSIDRFATFTGGSGTRVLTFAYTVQAGDTSADLDLTSSSALVLNGATIRDVAGNDAVLTLPAPGTTGSLGANAALVIDGTPPPDTTAPRVELSVVRNPGFAGSASAFGLTDVGFSARPELVDIDGDGDLDAFIGKLDGNTLFFRNTGNTAAPAFAGFASAFGLPNVMFRTHPAVADIDGDGDLDAFIGNYEGVTLFFRNTGSATAPAFAGSASAFGFPDVGNNARPELADIDGDGDLDAFIGDRLGNTFFFRNTGNAAAPAFAGSSIGFGFPDVGFSASPAFADIDGDGDLDAFIGNEAGSTLFFRNTGNAAAPAFAGSSIGFGFPDVGALASPAFADIDGDGDLDAFIGEFFGSTLFFRNTGSGGLSSTNANGTYGAGSVITIEVPFSEAVVVDTTNGTPTLQLETGSTDRLATFIGGSGSRVLKFSYIVQAGDFSADLDLSSSSALLLNGATIRDAAGNNAVLTLPAPGTTGSLGANADLVIDGGPPPDTTAPRVDLSGFRNPAFAGSASAFRLPDVGTIANPEFADIDGDGDLDAFIGNSEGNTLFFRNTGSATAAAFAGSSIGFGFPDVGAFASPAFADTDGDGDLDAFIGNAAGNIFFFCNTGSAAAPAFATSASAFGLPGVGNDASLAFADIDGDGDLDAFIGNRLGNTLFFRNTAAPGATAPAFAGSASAFGLPDVGGYASPAFADIDSDGDLDAFIGNNAGSTLFFRNTGNATAPAFADSASAFGLPDVGADASPELVDIDGDGDLDAFIGNNNGSTLFFRNTGSGGLSSANPNGTYGPGSVITIEVPFSEVVFVTGTPTLLLETGSTDRTATYLSGSGTRVLSFSYTVQAGDTSADLDVTNSSALALNGGTIQDAAGNNAVLTLPAPSATGSLGANAALVIDGVVPTVSGIASSSSNGTYGVGSVLTLTVQFSEAVVVNTAGGTPTLLLETGSIDRSATYLSGSGTNTLTFQYTVQAGDTSADLDVTSSSALELNGGTISDAAGNNAVLTLPEPGAVGSLGAISDLVIDSSAPTVAGIASSSSNGTYGVGSVLTLTVQFSEAVVVNTAGGTPTLLLETGSIDRAATYVSGSGSNTLSFQYTVEGGDSSADLDVTSSSALEINGGTIRDAAGNNAVLTLPEPGAVGSLGATSDLVIDSSAPTVAGIASSNSNGTYGVGSVLTLTVQFSEAVVVNTAGGTPTLLMETGSIDRSATYLSGSGTNTLTFQYTVQAGDISADLDVTSSSALELNGGTISDAAGNNAVLTLPEPGAVGSLGANAALVIDGVAPVITFGPTARAD